MAYKGKHEAPSGHGSAPPGTGASHTAAAIAAALLLSTAATAALRQHSAEHSSL